MGKQIELPDAVYAALAEVAHASGTTPEDWIAAHLPQPSQEASNEQTVDQDWLDLDFLSASKMTADDKVTLDQVRQAMAKIPGRLVDDIRTERDER